MPNHVNSLTRAANPCAADPDGESARISFSGPATVVVTRFRTEKYYDFLEVGRDGAEGMGAFGLSEV